MPGTDLVCAGMMSAAPCSHIKLGAISAFAPGDEDHRVVINTIATLLILCSVSRCAAQVYTAHGLQYTPLSGALPPPVVS